MSIRSQLTKRHEGLSLKTYLCPNGYLTIGFGHNLDQHGMPDYIASLLRSEGIDWLNDGITPYYANLLFEEDEKWALSEVQGVVGEAYGELSEVRQAVLFDMCFQMGATRLGKFKNMLSAIDDGDYLTASIEMRDSKYAFKDTPQRALFNSIIWDKNEYIV